MNTELGKFVIKQKNGKYYDGNPSSGGVEDIQNAWVFNGENQAKIQCYEGETVENFNKRTIDSNNNKTTVDFSHDFKDGENIVFIAIKGTPESIQRELLRIASHSNCYGKPLQGIIVTGDSTSHVITPRWEKR